MEQDRKGLVTIRDVAYRAGVAVSTVSRVINGLDRVSESTRKTVMEAIDDLGYVPNTTAKTLKAKRSDAIGFISEDISSPYVPDVIRGIEETARLRNYSVILCNSNWDHNNTLRHLTMLMQRTIDGIIYSTPMRITDPLLNSLIAIRQQLPMVLIAEDNFDDGFNRVHVDVEDGMRQALSHLFRLGHSRISMIAGPENSGTNAIKINSYIAIMTAAGYASNIQYRYTDFSIVQGIETTKDFLEGPPGSRPTAIITAADLSAIGSIRGVKQMGLRTPEDVSIVGFGGIDYSLYTDPPLTSVSVPRYQLGIKAMELLLSCIKENKTVCSSGPSMLPVKLEIRGTTGPAGGAGT